MLDDDSPPQKLEKDDTFTIDTNVIREQLKEIHHQSFLQLKEIYNLA